VGIKIRFSFRGRNLFRQRPSLLESYPQSIMGQGEPGRWSVMLTIARETGEFVRIRSNLAQSRHITLGLTEYAVIRPAAEPIVDQPMHLRVCNYEQPEITRPIYNF
jgi:hypothetical protein